jgi:hypothetical protein
MKKQQKEEKKRWCGITGVGRSTEGIKRILKRKDLTYIGKGEEGTKYIYSKKREK